MRLILEKDCVGIGAKIISVMDHSKKLVFGINGHWATSLKEKKMSASVMSSTSIGLRM